MATQRAEPSADGQAVIRQLEARRTELASMGVRYLAIFGSVVRGEADSDSDIDILVDLERPAGLLKHAHLENYLTAMLGRAVDVVPRNSVRPELEDGITCEAVRVL